jgi:hypothetical protein
MRPAGIDKDLRTRDDIGIGSVFGPMITDATDLKHEQHACGHDRCENFGYRVLCVPKTSSG